MEFVELGLSAPLLKAVKEAGYTSPSPIQEKAIPPVLSGKDLLGCAQTGTGKTAAFALPILQRLSKAVQEKKRPIRALVLTPTRELALQIQESFEQYGKYLALRSAVIFGGVGQGPQVAALTRGVDVLVATPGRLNDLIGQGHVRLENLEIFVLDEADRMLDMGFVQDVKKVLRHIPNKRQTLLFSATMPKEIVELANGLLYKPAKVFVTPPSTTVEKIEQHLYEVDKHNKRRLLAHLLEKMPIESALVFTRTKHGADRVARDLKRGGIHAVAIHGNKSQSARQSALAQFKKHQARVMVATDIAARGLDINELSHVFNYDLPNVPETYVHRIGRTGRAGHGGVAISFCDENEAEYLRDIEKLIGFSIQKEGDNPWPLGQAPLAVQAAEEPARAPKQNPAVGSTAQGPAKAAPGRQAKAGGKQQAARAASKNGEVEAMQQKNEKKTGGKPKSEARKQTGKPGNGQRGGRNARQPGAKRDENPYENRTGGAAIITKRPVWGDLPAPATQQAEKQPEGEQPMSRNNRRRRGGKKRGEQAAAADGRPKQNQTKQDNKKQGKSKANDNGLFDFTEEELAEDTGIRLINDNSRGDAKYGSFEDYLKDH